VYVLDPATATAVVRAPETVDGLGDATVVVGEGLAEDLGITDGDTTTLTGLAADGSALAGDGVRRTAVVTPLGYGMAVTPGTWADLDVDASSGMVNDEAWVRLADDADPGVVVPAVQDALSDTAVLVAGAAVERAMYEQVIDTLLAVVVGLLAVAVVIALIGVANTLSLSVIERRRESATLRVIGLSRRRLRGTLAIEGVLIAGVGAALGIVLGVVYGWAGAATVLGVIGEVSLDVPWGHVAVVLAVSVVAGFLASVLPGRSAARTSPVAALAVD
jgi:putative ABC transport system permease protein